jgi:hypothetical protein
MVSVGYRTLAQETPTRAFRSDVDDLLTVERVSVLPFTDNLQGIYSRPLEAHFISLVDKMHRWDYVKATSSGPLLSPEELEAAPDKALQLGQSLGADAFFASRISKGPNGVMIHVSLFLAKDGKLLAQAILKDYKQFNIEDLKEQTQRLLNEIVARLPYAGRILSRDANRVTVNLGLSDGLQKGQMLSVIQIVQAHRHPKFNFLIKTEKEIFGKVKILKVDETLSFGVVVSEKERGAIQKNAKIGALDFVTYSGNESLSLTPPPEDALSNRDDSAIAFGKDAREWRPQKPATFGQVGARLGMSQYSGSTQVSGVGALEANTFFAPSVLLEGELWITPEWTARARIKQGIVSVGNPRSGSTPGDLNQSLTYYELVGGYRLRFGPYAWSPYAEPFFGFMNFKLFTDNASPEAYTTQQFSGFKFGVNGAAPLGQGGEYGIGGEFAMVWKPTLKESPVTSGDSNEAQVVQFGVLGFKKLGERLKLQGNLDFEMYSANFSGAGTRAESASSSSHRFTTISGGLYYQW